MTKNCKWQVTIRDWSGGLKNVTTYSIHTIDFTEHDAHWQKYFKMGLGIFPFFCFLFAGVIGLFKQKEYLSFISRTCSSELYSFSVLIISLTNSVYTHHLFKGPLIQQHWEQETESRYLLYSGTCIVPVSVGPGLIVSAQISTLYWTPPKTSRLWLKVWLFFSLVMVVCLPSMV